MATELQTETHVEQDVPIEEKIKRLRELFADAPQVGKNALENVLQELTSQASETPPPPVESAGRVGDPPWQGLGIDDHGPAGPRRSRPARESFLKLLGGNLAGADKVGSVHDMRFVFSRQRHEDDLRHHLRR